MFNEVVENDLKSLARRLSFHHACTFIDKAPSFGKSLVCADDKNLKTLLKRCKSKNFLTYGFANNSNYQITNLKKNKNFSTFDLKLRLPSNKKIKINGIVVNLIGDHNVKNATAAIAIAINLGIKPNIIIEFARLYGFQVDFQRDIWKNDSFQIIYEEFKNEQGKVVDTGEIIYANLNLQNIDLQLYKFEFEKIKSIISMKMEKV